MTNQPDDQNQQDDQDDRIPTVDELRAARRELRGSDDPQSVDELRAARRGRTS